MIDKANGTLKPHRLTSDWSQMRSCLIWSQLLFNNLKNHSDSSTRRRLSS